MRETRYFIPDADHPYDRPIDGEIMGTSFVTEVGNYQLNMPPTAFEARKIGIRELKRKATTDPKAKKALDQLVMLTQVDIKVTRVAQLASIETAREKLTPITDQIEAEKTSFEQKVAALKTSFEQQVAALKVAHTERMRVLEEQKHEAEADTLRAALVATDWKVQPAAALLGVSHMSLERLLQGKQRALRLEVEQHRAVKKALR